MYVRHGFHQCTWHIESHFPVGITNYYGRIMATLVTAVIKSKIHQGQEVVKCFPYCLVVVCICVKKVDGVQHTSTGCLVLESRRNSTWRAFSTKHVILNQHAEHNIHQIDYGYFRESYTESKCFKRTPNTMLSCVIS